jgi:hypothetical protein
MPNDGAFFAAGSVSCGSSARGCFAMGGLNELTPPLLSAIEKHGLPVDFGVGDLRNLGCSCLIQ